jgi:hypothetical protein
MPETEPEKAKPDPGDKTPDWLSDLQKKSWEPEVIISGLFLAFIFLFPAHIYDFSARLIQDFGLEFTGALIMLLYLATVINVFKIFFIAHIVLRLAWAGVLGLSYAFPGGVINENLFKTGRDLDYSTPLSMVLRLERICSMAFAFPLSIGIIIAVVSLYLALLLVIGVAFSLSFFTLYMIFMITIFAFALFTAVSKKSKLKQRLATTMYASIQATYQSNLGKWTTVVYLVLILGMSVPFVIADTKGFTMYNQDVSLGSDQREWPDASRIYEDRMTDNRRFPRAMVPSGTHTGDLLPISIAWYKADVRLVEQIRSGYAAALDTLGREKPEAVQDLFRIHLNDSLVTVQNWQQSSRAGSSQRIFTGLIDLKGLEPGGYNIRVEKLAVRELPFSTEHELRVLEFWAAIPFLKTSDSQTP